LTYIVFRHENAFGNTCEQIINLAILLKKENLNPEMVSIAVEHSWQKDLVDLIDESGKFNVLVLGDRLHESFQTGWANLPELIKDPILPSYYSNSKNKSYKAGWEWIDPSYLPILKKLNGKEFDVVIQFRVKDSWTWRGETGNTDLSRYVNQDNFIELIRQLCELGFRVARIGHGSNEKILEHLNFIDTTLIKEFTLKDQLQLISNARLFISTDSSIWPLGPALGTPTIISNVTSVFEFFEPLPFFHFRKFYLPHGKLIARKSHIKVIKPYIFNWIGPHNHYILKPVSLFLGVIKIKDNSVKDLLPKIKEVLI
jgi:putative glycosyltransferase (TIGR04372 family)